MRILPLLAVALATAVVPACSGNRSSYGSGTPARTGPVYAAAPARSGTTYAAPAPTYAPSYRSTTVSAPAPMAPSAGRSANTAYVFVASWCGYCQKLKRNTLSDPSVQAELAALNWQQVDPDQPQGKALAQRYGVSGYPTTVIVNPSGSAVKKIVGYTEPNEYLPQLRQGR